MRPCIKYRVITLREKCPHSVWMRENADRNNSEWGNFFRSVDEEAATLQTEKQYITLFATPEHLVWRNPDLPHYLRHNRLN